jgi:hypothetical protein
MDNLTPNQSQRNPYPCRKCGKTIYWHRAKSGKNYPCDSADNPRLFHKCLPATQSPPSPKVEKPKPEVAPLTPSYDFNPEPSIEQRVEHIEKQLAALVRTVKAVESRQPITDSDLPEGF